ncbi:MAG: hypothetical protein LBD37_06865 [Treponema sp.]|jgi:hypothetical protein|nr:hypothetical protein [Treponema sp.]
MNHKALGKKAAAFLGAALVCLAAGCATTYQIEWHKVELSADRPDRGPLLNLQNAGQWIDRWENTAKVNLRARGRLFLFPG